MQIRLEKHVGKTVAGGGLVDLKQDRIFADGELVGYVGRKLGAPINLIMRLPEEAQAAIRQAVDAQYGAAERRVAMPPALPEEATAEDDLADE